MADQSEYAPLDATVSDLRERLEKEDAELRTAANLEPLHRATPTRSQPALHPQPLANLNDQVLLANREGLDIKEISRRFHIGVDQAALILKMAKKP